MTSPHKKKQRADKFRPGVERDAIKIRLNEMIRLLWYLVWILLVIALIQFAFFIKDIIAVWIS